MPPLRSCCIDHTGWKTKVACVVLAMACHFLLGSLFHYTLDDNNLKFHYPNLGSSMFVLSVSLYATSRSLHPKSLCIHRGVLQTIYKVFMVIIISNILLVAVWQQLVSIVVELVLTLHDLLAYSNLPCAWLVERTGCYLCHMIGFVMLLWVVTNVKCLFMCKPPQPALDPPSPQDPPTPFPVSASDYYDSSTSVSLDDSWDSFFT